MCLVGSYCNPLQWLKIGCDDETTLLVNFVVNRKNGCLPCSSKGQQRKGSLQLMHTFVKKKKKNYKKVSGSYKLQCIHYTIQEKVQLEE